MTTEQTLQERFAQVLVDLDTKALDRRTFSYRIPEGMEGAIAIGTPVTVPFGRISQATGYVVGFTHYVDPDIKIKEIADILDDQPLFDLAYLNFLDWVAQYTATPLMTVLSAALPSSMLQKTRREVVLLQPEFAFDPKEMIPLSTRKILAFLKSRPPQKGVRVRYVSTQTGVPLKMVNQVLYKWQSNGVVQLRSKTTQTVRKNKTKQTDKHDKNADLKPLMLNQEQAKAVQAVLNAKAGSDHLLYGVTGSGKTEVYIGLTQAVLDQGQSVLIMVPEISLTSHIARRFIERFGREQIALWHSHLSAGEKVETWRRVSGGELRIMIGARSAIFTPMQNLGLIVMDEEHDGSFKQDTPAPRYSAKTLAAELSRRTGAKLLFGSATPDVELYRDALERGCVLPLNQRYGGQSLAEVTVVDMRKAKAAGQKGSISEALKEAITETVSLGHQVILLLNRRGYYTLILCDDCGETVQCPNCSVSLTFHRTTGRVRCHYCGYDAPKSAYCPHCAGTHLSFTGMGTQRLEQELIEAIPDLRVLRLDSDVMTKKYAHRDIFDAFTAKEADVLIGTQMVAKGLDIANVTLVGVINADTAFSLPDYKAAERGFQLLTQVAGRAGRGAHAGQVIIQSLQPTHPVILRAKDQDYLGFYEDELVRRQEFDFPPYSQLFRFIASGLDEFQVRNFLKAITINLSQQLEQAGFLPHVQLLGPAPCVVGRIQGRYRYHVMVKNRAGTPVHQLLTRHFMAIKPPDDVNFLLDVDAQSFL